MVESTELRAESAFAQCLRVQEEAAHVGFDWNDVHGPIAKIIEETDELKRAIDAHDTELAKQELGDVLLSVVNVARHMNVDPERILNDATRRFAARFERMRGMLDGQGVSLCDCSLEEMDAAWEISKRRDTGHNNVDGK